MFLSEILKEKRHEVQQRKISLPLKELKAQIDCNLVCRKFGAHISKNHTINVIAEIKKASPSRGLIRENFNPVEIAGTYQSEGAAAISVLTETKFFQGSLDYIKEVRQVTNLPVLRKDFIIDEYQVYESAFYQADAFLLIADILSEEELTGFLCLGHELGMDVLVEVHTEEDLEKALKTEANIIGINNRNLTTFKVDIETTQRLISQIPKDKIKVSESGINTSDQVLFLKSLGVNAVLIGEAFMKSDDIQAKMRELMQGL